MTTPAVFPKTVSGWLQIIAYTVAIIGAVFGATAFLINRDGGDDRVILELLNDVRQEQMEIRNDLRDIKNELGEVQATAKELETNVDWLKRYLPIPQLGAR